MDRLKVKMIQKNKRKILWILCLLLALLCAGCRNTKNPNGSSEKVQGDQQTIETTAVEQESEEKEEVSEAESVELDESKDWKTEDLESETTYKENTVAPRLDFPIEIEGGKLTIESVFQYSGINVDANDEICEDVGALQLKNSSGEYLESADVVVLLSEGDELNFHIEDLPAGESIMAFEVHNSVYDVSQSVKEMTAKPVWKKEASLKKESLKFETDGLIMKVTNISEKEIKKLTVKYHCSFDGIYFGGKSYEKVIDVLGAGKSIRLDASECYFGEAAIVNVLN